MALGEQLQRNEVEVQVKKAQVQKNYKILREELYQQIMKPYFSAG